MDIEGDSASEIVQSMKEKIFLRRYENTEKYVSFAHLFSAFCLPILASKIFLKPRAEHD
tara:strand:+ start:6713 stop:6889 length:177 start_codon:yes stop_codon:yes gene_type:complete